MTTRKITYINANDAVSAPVTNMPLRQLKQETDELRAKFDTTEAGNTLICRDIPCDSSVKVGMPVYWDGKAQCCKPAYLSAELNTLTQEYETGTPADCIGLVCRKTSTYSVDILIAGLVNFPELQEYLDGGTGRFYLGSSPGSLSLIPNAQAFPLGVVLGTLGPCDSAYRVYLNPCYTNNLLQHQHYSIDLKPENWSNEILPDHEDAPTGAILVYNIEEDEDLRRIWPPIPITAISATIDWGKDGESIGGKELTINKEDSLLYIDESNIYWTSSTTLPMQYSENYKLTLHFSKIRYSTRNAFITSLQPDSNQPFKFVDCKGQEASSGDLYIQFTLNNDVVDSTNYNGVTLQEFTENWKSKMVPTVHGLAVEGNAVVTGTGTSFTKDGTEYKTGALKLDISPYAANTELVPQIIKVGAAQEREIYGITYLGLPAGRSSSLNLKFEVPANYSIHPISFKLRMQCIAQGPDSEDAEETSYANATIKYYKVNRATERQYISNLKNEARIIPCNFSRGVVPGTMFEVESSSITVTAGDTVIVIISRDSNSSYNTDLAIARINGILNIQEG